MGNELARCNFCNSKMKPRNRLAKGHLCRTCLKEIQVGDRIAE